MKRLTALLLGIVMALSLTACGGDNSGSSSGTGSSADTGSSSGGTVSTYNWKAASTQAVGGPWDLALIEFSRLLSEKSDGAISLEVYSNGQLGNENETIAGVQMGTIDFVICSSASLSSFTSTNDVWDLPYLFDDLEQARKATESDTAQELLDSISDVGLKGLSYWENGMYAIAATKPVESLSDMNGLLVRSIDSSLQTKIYESMGASPVVLAWSDIYTSVQQGVVHAISSTTIINMHNSNFEEVAPYITLTNHGYSPASLIMTQTMWDGLPEDIQKIVQEAADEARLYELNAMDEALEVCRTEMEAAGAEFIEVDTAEFKDAVSVINDEYVGAGKIDPDVVEALQTAAKK